MKDQTLFTFFGHHKCASSWIQRILWNLATDSGFSYQRIGRMEKGEERRITKMIEDPKFLRILGLPNARWEMVRYLPDFRGVHVVRDPRDMLVSAYFSHLKSHRIYPNTPRFYIEHRERLQEMTQQEGLLFELEGPMKEVFEDMRKWRPKADSRVLEVQMEDLVKDPYCVIRDIFERSGFGWDDRPKIRWWLITRFNQAVRRVLGWNAIQCDHGDIKSLRWHTGRLAFSRITGRELGQENTSSHLRKGIPGDWRNYFWRGLGSQFVKHYGDLLLMYDYEVDCSWVDQISNKAVPGSDNG